MEEMSQKEKDMQKISEKIDILHDKFEIFMKAIKIFTIETAQEIDDLERIVEGIKLNESPSKKIILFPSNGDRNYAPSRRA